MESVRTELEKRGKSLAAEKIELQDKVKQVRNSQCILCIYTLMLALQNIIL